MTGRTQSLLMSGVALASVAVIAVPQSVQPRVLEQQTPVALVADVQVTAQPADYPSRLFNWWQPIFWPSASQPFPSPPSPIGPTPQSLPDTLEWAYHAVEPWVRYGFELATYAAGWVPYVGWLSGQIMIFYNFGERIVHAIAHNTLEWLNGEGSFVQNVADGIWWSIDALIQLGIDEWNYFLPPLPPLPPWPFAAEVGGFLNGVRAVLRDTVIGFLQALSASLPSRPDETLELAAVPAAADLTLTAFGDESSAEDRALTYERQGAPAEGVGGDEAVIDDQSSGDDGNGIEAAAEEVVQVVVPDEAEEVEDAKDEASPTTDTSGAVSAQGEVRGPITAPEQDPAGAPLSTDNGTKPVEDEVENPTGMVETPSPTDDKPVTTPSEEDGEPGVE
jgi:hypothetical protein